MSSPMMRLIRMALPITLVFFSGSLGAKSIQASELMDAIEKGRFKGALRASLSVKVEKEDEKPELLNFRIERKGGYSKIVKLGDPEMTTVVDGDTVSITINGKTIRRSRSALQGGVKDAAIQLSAEWRNEDSIQVVHKGDGIYELTLKKGNEVQKAVVDFQKRYVRAFEIRNGSGQVVLENSVLQVKKVSDKWYPVLIVAKLSNGLDQRSQVTSEYSNLEFDEDAEQTP